VGIGDFYFGDKAAGA